SPGPDMGFAGCRDIIKFYQRERILDKLKGHAHMKARACRDAEIGGGAELLFDAGHQVVHVLRKTVTGRIEAHRFEPLFHFFLAILRGNGAVKPWCGNDVSLTFICKTQMRETYCHGEDDEDEKKLSAHHL